MKREFAYDGNSNDVIKKQWGDYKVNQLNLAKVIKQKFKLKR